MRLKNYLLRSHSYSQGLLARSLSVPLQTDLSATSSETSLRHFRPWECSGGGGGPAGQVQSTSHHSWNHKSAHS